MKKIYTLIAIAITSLGFAQGTETFANIANTNNYGTKTWTGDNGMTWTATDSREDQTLTTKAITVRTGSLTGVLSTAQAESGVGTLTFDYKIPFSDATKDITVVITAGTETYTYNLGTLTQNTVYNSIEIELNAETAENIEFNVSSVATGARLTIDNISWTAYEAEEETPEPVEPTATFASESLSGFTYIEAQGPSTSQSVVVNVTDLTSENTLSVVSLNTNFEVVNAPSLVNGANTIEIRLASGLEAGEYTGEVQVTLGETILDTITLTGEVTDAPLSNVSNDIEGLRIYPNPANDVVTISTNSSAVKSVQMFDISGKQVLNVDTDSTINVSTLSKGIYVVKIVEEGKTSTSKLVIK